MLKRLRRLLASEGRGGERGQSFVTMLLIILPVLIVVFGIVVDLGHMATSAIIAGSAADMAAAEAGKLIDADHYQQWQEVRLRPEALLVAEQVAGEMTDGAFVVELVYIDEEITVVEGYVTIRTPFLGAFLGIETVDRPVQGIAETAHGAEAAGE